MRTSQVSIRRSELPYSQKLEIREAGEQSLRHGSQVVVGNIPGQVDNYNVPGQQ